MEKGVKEPLLWSESLRDKFEANKLAFTKDSILKLPDINLPFVLRTDASSCDIGAVLRQYVDGCPLPCAYASRKLLDREKRYSTIERECLAIIFGVKRFEYYLVGKEFVLEVDHNHRYT